MKKMLPWLTALALLVVIFGSIYGVVQQAQRHGANYPQIQLAEDTATALNAGAKPQAMVKGRVDMAASLAPFVIIYSKTGQVVTGSGYLDGRVPQVPVGVLTNSNNKVYHSITWQPRDNVRLAAISVAANNYYVLSGRSLTEVEKNETRSFQLSLAAGLVAAAIIGAAFWLDRHLR